MRSSLSSDVECGVVHQLEENVGRLCLACLSEGVNEARLNKVTNKTKGAKLIKGGRHE